tara:strand:+ start:415 stop:678 length:264 start_codon:yes stop_codon:yes gene_type:complete
MLVPMNRYLVVKPVEEKKTSTGVLIPDNVSIETNRYRVAEVTRAHLESELKSGMLILVPSHMVEEASFFGETYYLVLENHVIGRVEG